MLSRFALIVATLSGVIVASPAMAGCVGERVRADLTDRWKDANGNPRWPNEDWSGALNVTILLMPGTEIDHYGCDNATRFSPQGTAFSARALPYDCASEPYRRYRVAKPLLVRELKVQSWFGQKGGGTQYRTTTPAEQLINEGALEVVEAERPSCG